MRIKSILAAMAACAVMVSSASAATMNYLLSYTDNGSGNFGSQGQFAVYGWSSLGDNSGIASFNFTVTGQTSIVNRAPQAMFADENFVEDNKSSGFTLLRQTGGSGLATTGSFDTVSGNGLIVYGLGQTGPGSVRNATPPAGFAPTSTVAQGAYGLTNSFLTPNSSGFQTPTGGAVPILLATGTYASGFGSLTLTTGLSALFNTTQNGTSSLPTVYTVSYRPLPEPAALAGVAVIGVGLLRRRRTSAA